MVIRPRAAIKIRYKIDYKVWGEDKHKIKINYKVWGEVRYKRGNCTCLTGALLSYAFSSYWQGWSVSDKNIHALFLHWSSNMIVGKKASVHGELTIEVCGQSGHCLSLNCLGQDYKIVAHPETVVENDKHITEDAEQWVQAVSHWAAWSTAVHGWPTSLRAMLRIWRQTLWRS